MSWNPAVICLPLVLLGVGLFLVVGGVGMPEPEPREWQRTYTGYLPRCRDLGIACLLVTDERTGEVLEGVRVQRHYEYHMDREGWAPVEATFETDSRGLAWLRVAEDDRFPAHWSLHKQGYAPTEVYGSFPQEHVRLAPGVDRHGRLLDAAGRPAAGIDVELKLGCAHAPALRVARTDRQGYFVLPCVGGEGDLVYGGPGVRADYWNSAFPSPLDESAPVEVAEPGMRIEGYLTGIDVPSLDLAVVRCDVQSRGPLAPVDPDGRFVLEGADPNEPFELWVFPSEEPDESGSLEFRPGGPFRWDLSPGAAERRESEPTHTVQIRLVGPEGNPVPSATYVYMDRLRDGRRFSGYWEGADDEPAEVEVPVGSYDVQVGGRFDEYVSTTSMRVDVAGREQDAITVPTVKQPALHVVWDGYGEEPPSMAVTVILIEPDGRINHAWTWSEDSYLPADSQAVLRVQAEDEALFFQIGAERDGLRTARPQRSEPKTLRFRVPSEDVKIALRGGRPKWEFVDGDAVFTTRQSGRMTLAVWEKRVNGEDVERRSEERLVTIPDEPGAVVRLAPFLLSPTPKGQLRLSRVDGGALPPDLQVLAWDPRSQLLDDDWEVPVQADGMARSTLVGAGARVVLQMPLDAAGPETSDDEAWGTFTAVLLGAGPYAVEIPTASLRLDIRSGAGGDLKSPDVLWSESPEFRQPEWSTRTWRLRDVHRCAFRFLAAGRHRFTVGAEGHLCEEFQIELKEGEQRRIEVVLQPRPPLPAAKEAGR